MINSGGNPQWASGPPPSRGSVPWGLLGAILGGGLLLACLACTLAGAAVTSSLGTMREVAVAINATVVAAEITPRMPTAGPVALAPRRPLPVVLPSPTALLGIGETGHAAGLDLTVRDLAWRPGVENGDWLLIGLDVLPAADARPWSDLDWRVRDQRGYDDLLATYRTALWDRFAAAADRVRPGDALTPGTPAHLLLLFRADGSVPPAELMLSARDSGSVLARFDLTSWVPPTPTPLLPTATPTAVPPFPSGGLGLAYTDWTRGHPGGRHSGVSVWTTADHSLFVQFWLPDGADLANAPVQSIDWSAPFRTPAPTLAQARALAASWLPADARLAWSAQEAPVVVEVYTSRLLAGRYAGGQPGWPPWFDSPPGTILVAYTGNPVGHLRLTLSDREAFALVPGAPTVPAPP